MTTATKDITTDLNKHVINLLHSKSGSKVRTAIRQYCKVGGDHHVPIMLATSDDARYDPPSMTGTAGYYTFNKSDTIVKAPGAARKAGHKIKYHRDSRVITVGYEWVLYTYVIEPIMRETLV